MTTHHDVRCPACHKKVRLAPDFRGKRVGCPYCKHIFQPALNEPKDQGTPVPPAPPLPDPSADALRGQITLLQAELEKARGELTARTGVDQEAALRAAEAQVARLRDELAACQESCRQLTQQQDASKAEVERLRELIRTCGITIR